MNLIFDCIIFGGKPKGIPAHWVKYIVALHSLFPRHNIQCCIGAWMSHMKSLSRWIRELYQSIVFRLGKIICCRKCLLVFPYLLPFLLNLFWIVR